MRIRMAAWTAMVVASLVFAGCGGSDDESESAGVDPTTATTATTAVNDDVEEATTTTEESSDGGTGTDVAALEAVVLGGWDSIWSRDFESLLLLYNDDCQARVSVEDFEKTLGLGVDFLEESEVDFDDIGVQVMIDDVVENESATSISILSFPGDEPSEEDPASWVVVDGEWRRTDCDEVAGASDADLSEGDVGTASAPAAFGSVFEFEDWRGTFIDVVDAVEAGVVSDSSEPAPDGETYLFVVYSGHYLGSNLGESEPFLVRGVGSSVYESFENDCFLDASILASQGIPLIASALPGGEITTGACLSVPISELGELVFELENAFSFAAPEVVFASTGTPGDDLPPPQLPDVDIRDGALAPGESRAFGADWSGTVVTVVDGVEEGLISEFAEGPPTGSTHAVIVYEATYSGPELTVSDPFVVQAFGSAVYSTINSPCVVDRSAAGEAYDVSDAFEFAPGELIRGATCVTAPIDELNQLVIEMDNVFDIESDPARFAPG